MVTAGVKFHLVASVCGMSESSVRRIWKVYENTGSSEPFPRVVRPGRKCILDELDHEVSNYLELLYKS